MKMVRVWVLLVAAGIVVLVMYPALHQRGALAHRDLLFLDQIPLPRSAWWMGPDLGRRMPGFIPLAAMSDVISGELVGRLVLLLTMMIAAKGTSTLAGRLLLHGDEPTRVSAWLAAAAGPIILCVPFTLTRMSTGHLTTLWALACLPFLLIAADRDPEQIGRSRACTAAALTGFVAGIYALVIVVAVSPRRTRWSNLRSWGLRSSVWILPGLFLQLHGFTTLSEPDRFKPRFATVWQVFGLVVGRGYWDTGAEVLRGRDRTIALISLGLVALAAIGWRRVTGPARRAIAGCLIVGYGVPVASVAPGLGWVVSRVVNTPMGAPLREPHRLIGLGVTATIILATRGAGEISEWRPRRQRLTAVAAGGSLAIAGCWMLLLAVPTVHIRLQPLRVPPDWIKAADMVEDSGGNVLVLPWSEYVLLELGKPRVVYNPLADLFGSDTLASSDPKFGPPVNEAADARSTMAAAAGTALVEGENAGPLLEQVQARWVAVLKVEQVSRLDLSTQPALRRRLTSATLDLYEVVDTEQPSYRRPVPFIVTGGTGTTDIPWTWGWVGSEGKSSGGTLIVHGSAVFLPSVLAIVLYVCVVSLLFHRQRPR